MSTRRVCIFTGTRAEWGLLRWIAQDVRAHAQLELQLIASGTHLDAAFGETRRFIEEDGFAIDAEVDLALGDDSPVGVARSMAAAVAGTAEALERLRPDVLVLLGDRYEVLAAAEAALLARVPVAHLHGGEVTSGSIDDSMRHATTKLSHLHFVAAEEYRQRVIQLGEDPARVFNVGAPGLDHLTRMRLMDRAALTEELDLPKEGQLFLLTYHPATAGEGSDAGMQAVLDAIERFPNASVIATLSNADVGGQTINEMLRTWAAERRDNVHLSPSLGQLRYLSAMAAADLVLGNSSSGLIEAPALGTPVVNVGARQDGRLRAPAVIDADANADAVAQAMSAALSPEFREVAAERESPYGTPGASERIVRVLAQIELSDLFVKHFQDLGSSSPAANVAAP